MAEQKVRVTPRISVNKLAEYMVATPARRRGIIRDQKVARELIVTRYQSVYGGIAEALAVRERAEPARPTVSRITPASSLAYLAGYAALSVRGSLST